MLPTSFSLALTIVLALAPGFLAWWTGRTILAKADDPVLPELLVEREKRLEMYALIGGLAIAVQFVDRALWALPRLWLTLGLSFRPLRRGLYGERLSALAFLRYFICSAIGQFGPWFLARCAPALVVSFALEMAPNDHAAAVRLALWGGLVSAAIIVLWKYYYSHIFLDLHRATPLRSSARPELMAKLDAST